jgi:tetratricopeptide (TPR) repeat protein
MYQRGLARLRLGLHREAAHDFGKCIELDSKYAKALLGKGLAKMAHGDTDEAITSFTECLALDGRLSAARYQRAVLYTLRE